MSASDNVGPKQPLSRLKNCQNGRSRPIQLLRNARWSKKLIAEKNILKFRDLPLINYEKSWPLQSNKRGGGRPPNFSSCFYFSFYQSIICVFLVWLGFLNYCLIEEPTAFVESVLQARFGDNQKKAILAKGFFKYATNF